MPYADKEKQRARDKRYREKNRAKRSAALKAWYERNPEKRRIYNRRRTESGHGALYQRTAYYGITPQQYDEILASQGHVCAVCGDSFTARPCVDHDHKTGKVRGILHRQCNAMLGMARDSPERLDAAARYLRARK